MKMPILFLAFLLISALCLTYACGPGEEYQSCGTACPKTCDNYNMKGRFCILVCKSGCFCKGNLVRRKSDKKCVKTSEC